MYYYSVYIYIYIKNRYISKNIHHQSSTPGRAVLDCLMGSAAPSSTGYQPIESMRAPWLYKLKFASGAPHLSLEDCELQTGGHQFSLKEQLALVCTSPTTISSVCVIRNASSGARSGRRRSMRRRRRLHVATAAVHSNLTLKKRRIPCVQHHLQISGRQKNLSRHRMGGPGRWSRVELQGWGVPGARGGVGRARDSSPRAFSWWCIVRLSPWSHPLTLCTIM